MKLVARLSLVAVLAAGLASVTPAVAAPFAPSAANVQTALRNYAETEEDAAKKAALEEAAALFDNTSKTYAADIQDILNAVRKIEKAFGADDPAIGGYLDGVIQQVYIAAFARAQQAYVGAALKETSRGNYKAIQKLANTHTKQVNAANRSFPAEETRPITRVARLAALLKLEKYGAALAKRYKVTQNVI